MPSIIERVHSCLLLLFSMFATFTIPLRQAVIQCEVVAFRDDKLETKRIWFLLNMLVPSESSAAEKRSQFLILETLAPVRP
jgi:hypothetical protein